MNYEEIEKEARRQGFNISFGYSREYRQFVFTMTHKSGATVTTPRVELLEACLLGECGKVN